MDGTDALSSSNAWAVGWSGFPEDGIATARSWHWNGKTWISVTPVQQTQTSFLEAVSAVSGTNVWAGGSDLDGCTLQHWTGQKWANVACPDKGLSESEINGIDARTASDVWAVGDGFPASEEKGLAEHWNGSSWTQHSTASAPGVANELASVDDLGAGNALAVGVYETKVKGAVIQHALAEHWTGTAWKRVTVAQSSTPSDLLGIAGTPATGILAVGYVKQSSGNLVPLIEKWNGSAFVRVTQPVSSGDLGSVTVLSGSNAYASGETGAGAPLVEHWNGTAWAKVSIPAPSGSAYLAGISAASASFVVAAGWHDTSAGDRALLEQRTGTAWKIAVNG